MVLAKNVGRDPRGKEGLSRRFTLIYQEKAKTLKKGQAFRSGLAREVNPKSYQLILNPPSKIKSFHLQHAKPTDAAQSNPLRIPTTAKTKLVIPRWQEGTPEGLVARSPSHRGIRCKVKMKFDVPIC